LRDPNIESSDSERRTARAAAVADAPLVSIIVRSMGRPELRSALQSIASQDYPAIDAIIVDATGGNHPEVPRLPWKPGHTLRMARTGTRLPRPMAADVGLQAVRGTWFTFLDDDDTCDPSHVSTLVAAAREHRDALVVYGCGRLLDAEGREQRIVGQPFNRALMHYTPLFYWQAALIRTRVRDLGCRFDSTLAVCEDRDFLLQVASHGDFVFLPGAATFKFRPDLGTSGTGHGVNRDAARVARFDNLLRAKWAGVGELHNERAAWRCRAGVRAYFAGDLQRSRAMFEQVLAEYPDDPNALHGMGRVALALGRREDAARYVRKAIEVNPRAADYRATLAEIAPEEIHTRRQSGAASRLGVCSCGSGRRFKACCGNLARPGNTVDARDPDLEHAQEERLRGNATSAIGWFRRATADPRASRECLVAAARVELDLAIAEAAFPLLERAAAMRVDTEVGVMLEECCALLAKAQRDASLRSTLNALVAPSWAFVAEGQPAAATVHIVVDAARPSRIDVANRMREALGRRAAVLAIEPGSALPVNVTGACLVLIDDDLDIEASSDSHPARVIVRMDHEDAAPLVRALVRARDLFPGASLQFTRPYEAISEGVPAAMPVEYPWFDPALLDAAPNEDDARVSVGRHGPAGAAEDHPNDPALYRALIGDGHRVLVPETPFLRRAFRDDALDSRPEFLFERNDWKPDRIPDVVFYRGRPAVRGGADARILEAMAAARPVVVFAQGLGAREWIEHGKSGFIVDAEDEARRCIDSLAKDASLRRAVGSAAREAAAALLRAQRQRARDFYFATMVNE